MNYLLGYIVSVFLVQLVGVLLIYKNDRSTDSEETLEEVLWSLWLATLLWPFALFIVIPAIGIWISISRIMEKRYTEVYNRRPPIENKEDRTWVTVVAEKDLKMLLKGHRKQYITLSPIAIEVIRDELLHRVTEKSLLK